MACPICKNETIEKFRPFCSKRCSEVDLHRWLSGSYAIGNDGEITHNTDIHEIEEEKPIEYRFDN